MGTASTEAEARRCGLAAMSRSSSSAMTATRSAPRGFVMPTTSAVGTRL